MSAIHRDVNKKIEYWRVCSNHFFSGKPSNLIDRDHPDWIPTLNLGHTTSTSASSTSKKERYDRVKMRREAKKEIQASNGDDSDDDRVCDIEFEEESFVEVDECVNESIDCESVFLKEISSLKEENAILKRKIENLSKNVEFVRLLDKTDFEEDDDKVTYYTRLPNSVVLMSLFDLISPGISQRSNCSLTAFQKFIITLMRLRLNLPVQDLAYRYGVGVSVISRCFSEIFDLLCVNLVNVVHWPSRDDLVVSMPMSFREKYGTKVVAIIDCFEVFVERPSNLSARAQTYQTINIITLPNT